MKCTARHEVDAVQITDEWFDGDRPNPLHPVGVKINPQFREVYVPQLPCGPGNAGDWLITEPDGQRHICPAGEFEAKYTPDDICQNGLTRENINTPEGVAKVIERACKRSGLSAKTVFNALYGDAE